MLKTLEYLIVYFKYFLVRERIKNSLSESKFYFGANNNIIHLILVHKLNDRRPILLMQYPCLIPVIVFNHYKTTYYKLCT